MQNKTDNTYIDVLVALKEKIRHAKQQAALSVNTQLLRLYWDIGNTIINQQEEAGWGAKVIDRLAADLKTEFPDMTGLSVRNLKYMRAFATAYPDFVQVPPAQNEKDDSRPQPIVQAALAQLPWYHHITLLDKVKQPETRLFYIQKAAENGWSRDVMVHQIESGLHERQGKAITNFEHTLPKPQSDLARETLKSPYLFDFLGIGEEIQERELEKALTQHLKKFLLELGRGFAYVGNQYKLQIETDDFFTDLLFYNFHLHCFIVFELKVGPFKPEYAGKLNFYVNSINEEVKGKKDNSTIGVLLCKTPNKTVVKYALQGIESPLGIADYQLPKKLKNEMPTLEELEAAMEIKDKPSSKSKRAKKK